MGFLIGLRGNIFKNFEKDVSFSFKSYYNDYKNDLSKRGIFFFKLFIKF